VKGLEETFIPLQRNYGPLFDVLVVASEDHLHAKRKILKTELAGFHFPILCVTALAVFAVYLVAAGMFGVPAGLLASLVFCLTPQVVAHSQNNLKDTPLMTFFALSLAAFFAAVTRDRFWRYAAAGALAGVTYTIKINALLIYPIVGLWFVLFVGRSLKAYLRFT
jgi:4-amino-4-deoxy-L-arabinose transferase-like glycosyltransferase